MTLFSGNRKIFLITVIFSFLLIVGLLSYFQSQFTLPEKTVQSTRKACTVPTEFQHYIHDDKDFLPNIKPFFLFEFDLPQELISRINNQEVLPVGRGARSTGYQSMDIDFADLIGEKLIVDLPDYKLGVAVLIRHFSIELEYNPLFSAIVDHIDSKLKIVENWAPNPDVNLSSDQVFIYKISRPEELAEKGMGKIECIISFWKNVDEVYLVEPKSSDALKYFGDEGVAYPPEPEEDRVLAPFGLYAAKYVNGTPLVLHFVWAADDYESFYDGHATFFKDKPYSVFDVLWSIRFDAIR